MRELFQPLKRRVGEPERGAGGTDSERRLPHHHQDTAGLVKLLFQLYVMLGRISGAGVPL